MSAAILPPKCLSIWADHLIPISLDCDSLGSSREWFHGPLLDFTDHVSWDLQRNAGGNNAMGRWFSKLGDFFDHVYLVTPSHPLSLLAL